MWFRNCSLRAAPSAKRQGGNLSSSWFNNTVNISWRSPLRAAPLEKKQGGNLSEQNLDRETPYDAWTNTNPIHKKTSTSTSHIISRQGGMGANIYTPETRSVHGTEERPLPRSLVSCDYLFLRTIATYKLDRRKDNGMPTHS